MYNNDMKKKKQRIGEILLENRFITKDVLNEALEYQRQFGGGITQYLIIYGYINEEELAKCLCAQFGLPYLLISVYDISRDVVKLIPVDIVKKYWLMPVDKMGDVLTVVMSDPFDREAIAKIEKITGCKVQPFVGILSDITKAIEDYYHVVIEREVAKERKPPPLFIDAGTYKGLERRMSIRLKGKIDVHFPDQERYKKSRIKNLSMHGFLFESDNVLPVGSYVTLQIDLPKEVSPYPIAAVVQVIRIEPLIDKKFDIGSKIIRIVKDDLKTIINYVLSGKS